MKRTAVPAEVTAAPDAGRRRAPRAAVGRADLVLLLDRLTPEQWARAAASLGFREEREPSGPGALFVPGSASMAAPRSSALRMMAGSS